MQLGNERTEKCERVNEFVVADGIFIFKYIKIIKRNFPEVWHFVANKRIIAY